MKLAGRWHGTSSGRIDGGGVMRLDCGSILFSLNIVTSDYFWREGTVQYCVNYGADIIIPVSFHFSSVRTNEALPLYHKWTHEKAPYQPRTKIWWMAYLNFRTVDHPLLTLLVAIMQARPSWAYCVHLSIWMMLLVYVLVRVNVSNQSQETIFNADTVVSQLAIQHWSNFFCYLLCHLTTDNKLQQR